MSKELLPCPHCGSHPYPDVQNDDCPLPLSLGVGYYRTVCCENCGAEGGKRPNDAEAIAAWNTRPTNKWGTAVEEIASLREVIEPIIIQRVMAGRIDGFTLNMADEIAAAILAGFQCTEASGASVFLAPAPLTDRREAVSDKLDLAAYPLLKFAEWVRSKRKPVKVQPYPLAELAAKVAKIIERDMLDPMSDPPWARRLRQWRLKP